MSSASGRQTRGPIKKTDQSAQKRAQSVNSGARPRGARRQEPGAQAGPLGKLSAFVNDSSRVQTQRKMASWMNSGGQADPAQFQEENGHPLQRIIDIHGGGENFEEIVVNFCAFAREHGGEAWNMLKWFWYGPHNVLDIRSVNKLDAKGYTDCRIKPGSSFIEAHTLADMDWATLKQDAPIKMTIFILNETGAPERNDTKTFYVVLHELMVHGYPFYLKMKSVREGKGPKTRSSAGYTEGPDVMGAHREHQALLSGENTAFHDLFRFIEGRTLTDMLMRGGIPERLKGFDLSEFQAQLDLDLMAQYTETTSAKYKKAEAMIKRTIESVDQTGKKGLSIPARILKYQEFISDFNKARVLVREAWREYYDAYQKHTINYMPPSMEKPKEKKGPSPDDWMDALPYVNPEAWSARTLKQLQKTIENARDIDQKINGYIEQLEQAIQQIK